MNVPSGPSLHSLISICYYLGLISIKFSSFKGLHSRVFRHIWVLKNYLESIFWGTGLLDFRGVQTCSCCATIFNRSVPFAAQAIEFQVEVAVERSPGVVIGSLLLSGIIDIFRELSFNISIFQSTILDQKIREWRWLLIFLYIHANLLILFLLLVQEFQLLRRTYLWKIVL